jgi:hypothetical protein
MKTRLCLAALILVVAAGWSVRAEKFSYHEIQTDAQGMIVPWFSPDPGEAYDHVLGLVWRFWIGMSPCPNGVPYYLQHQVWKPEHDPRGLGGDQLSMALSSWQLLYAYSGDRAVLSNMVLIADYWLDHGLSRANDAWPNLPYPYNTEVHSGIYDGDMRAGRGVLQPDKAASFGAELMTLNELTGNPRYLRAAVAIADTLAARVQPGDADHSPWPFRVNARTGVVPTNVTARYTANWTGALRLFDELIRREHGPISRYAAGRATLSAWLKEYPMRNHKWGPFFEDIAGWSDTEINADTLAWYILEHPQWDAHWRPDARAILDWSAATFATTNWARFGVTAIQEQTAYRVPGNSHSSRHASVELIYAAKTGDAQRKAAAIRLLNWATYTVDVDGKNRYPNDDIWLTDGYGDYVRHFLRAMAAAPELAPAGQNHLLGGSSVVSRVEYQDKQVAYATFDAHGQEVLRIRFAPGRVRAGGVALRHLATTAALAHGEGYTFNAPGDPPGTLRVRHDHARELVIASGGPD